MGAAAVTLVMSGWYKWRGVAAWRVSTELLSEQSQSHTTTATLYTFTCIYRLAHFYNADCSPAPEPDVAHWLV